MARSKKFNTVKRYYDRGLWNLEMVHNAVIKGWITEYEFFAITGTEFVEE